MLSSTCSICGQSYSIASPFCPHCGNQLQQVAERRHNQSRRVGGTDFATFKSASTRNPNKVAIVLLCLVLIGVGVLSYLLFWGGGNSQRPASLPPQSNNNRSLSPQATLATRDAIKALRKVEASTQVGVSYVQYGSLLIDAQAQVNEALALLPNGSLKNEIKQAMEAYNDAYLAWQITKKQGFIISSPPSGMIDSGQLIQKYSLPPSPLSGATSIYVTREDALNTIWKRSRALVERASSLLNQ
jgi:hypothetical protein